MAYAQTNYQEKVGNGNYRIAQIGCFLTAFCNLLESISISVDPPTLNSYFEVHGIYLSDPGDGAGVKDDLGWNSITSYSSRVVVTGTGTGWPNTNNAIVKFYYKAKSGAWETHFCKVADHNAHTIVDSWDGKIKPTGEYGEPVGYATYSSPSVQPVVTASNPPVVVNHPTTPPPSGPTELFLPSAAGTWRVYNVAGPYSSEPVDHSIHKLVPGAFPPGLTYQVLATLAPHVYKIQTQDYGQVAIYAGPGTIAQFPGGGHGEGESDNQTDPNAPAYDQAVSSDQGEHVPVMVASWQSSYKKFVGGPQRYVANTTVDVKDINDDAAGDNLNLDQELLKGQVVNVAGLFTRDGVMYYRTAKSEASNIWYGIPVTDLTKPGSDEELDQIIADIRKSDSSQPAAKTTNGFVGRLLHKK